MISRFLCKQSNYSHSRINPNRIDPDSADDQASWYLADDDAAIDADITTDSPRLPRLTDEQRDLVARHLGLVGLHLRTRVPTPQQPTRHREYDDLFQQGCMALARAAARYRPERDGPFAAYALPRIRRVVHIGLHDLFTVVRVPPRAIQHVRENPNGSMRRPPKHVQEMTEDIKRTLITMQSGSSKDDTIRHAIRRRLEIAIRRSLEQMQKRAWRHRNPYDIMVRIAYERLLINDERIRTPLRQIAREAKVSSGRACDYEKHLFDTVAAHLRRDPQARALVQMACEDKAGWDAILDASRRYHLMQAELHEFEANFTAMELPARAQVIYSMIERSSQCMPEVARNLFRLTLSLDDDPVRTVA